MDDWDLRTGFYSIRQYRKKILSDISQVSTASAAFPSARSAIGPAASETKKSSSGFLRDSGRARPRFWRSNLRHRSFFEDRRRRCGRRRRSWSRKIRRWRRKNRTQVALFQCADAIANSRSAFEFEILRSIAHLLFELRDGLHHLRLAGD